MDRGQKLKIGQIARLHEQNKEFYRASKTSVHSALRIMWQLDIVKYSTLTATFMSPFLDRFISMYIRK